MWTMFNNTRGIIWENIRLRIYIYFYQSSFKHLRLNLLYKDQVA